MTPEIQIAKNGKTIKRLFIKKQNSLRKYKEIGGKYKFDNGQDNGDLFIYPKARFVGIAVDKRRGFSCRVAFAAPKNIGKSVKERTLYWKKHSKKLMNGTLICLLWPEDTILVNKNNNRLS